MELRDQPLILLSDIDGTILDMRHMILSVLQSYDRNHKTTYFQRIRAEDITCHENRIEAEHPATLYPEVLERTLRDVAADYGVSASAEEEKIFGASVAHWPAFPDSAAALAYLKNHYKLVIVSNIDRASFAHSNAQLGIDFDLVITAEDVGSYKPAPGHFESAMAQLADMGIGKDKILHTAQSLYHDHVPAKKHFAMTTIWINRQAGTPGATPAADLDVAPDWEVPSMAAMVYLHRQHLAE